MPKEHYISSFQVFQQDSEDSLCGFLPGTTIISETNQIKVTFTADGSLTREGFNISYIAVSDGV